VREQDYVTMVDVMKVCYRKGIRITEKEMEMEMEMEIERFMVGICREGN
jgi:hypothetical protein